MRVHREACVVRRRFLPRAVLDLQAAEEAHNGHFAGPRLVAQDVPRPAFARGAAARDPVAEELRHDVREMERLRAGEMLPGPQQLLHLVQDPLVVRRGPLVRRPSLEEEGEAAIAACPRARGDARASTAARRTRP